MKNASSVVSTFHVSIEGACGTAIVTFLRDVDAPASSLRAEREVVGVSRRAGRLSWPGVRCVVAIVRLGLRV